MDDKSDFSQDFFYIQFVFLLEGSFTVWLVCFFDNFFFFGAVWQQWRGLVKGFIPLGVCLIAVMQWRTYRRNVSLADRWQISVYCCLPLRSLSRLWGSLAGKTERESVDSCQCQNYCLRRYDVARGRATARPRHLRENVRRQFGRGGTRRSATLREFGRFLRASTARGRAHR